MKFIKLVLTATFCASILVSAAAAASGEGSTHSITEADKRFFLKIQDAVENDDEDWLAEHIAFPIFVKINGVSTKISNKEDFLASYSQIINCRVESHVHDQNPNELFKNWRGIMVGNGAIWFELLAPVSDAGEKGEPRYLIIGINNKTTD